MANFLDLSLDWSSVATFVTGIAAVGAAYWTVKRTECSARLVTTQRVAAVAARAVAVMEVARERVRSQTNGALDSSPLLPWTAFSTLSADIGLLGVGATRLFIFIERLARTAERTIKDGGDPAEQLGNLRDAIARLLPMCESIVDKLYAEHGFGSRTDTEPDFAHDP